MTRSEFKWWLYGANFFRDLMRAHASCHIKEMEAFDSAELDVCRDWQECQRATYKYMERWRDANC